METVEGILQRIEELLDDDLKRHDGSQCRTVGPLVLRQLHAAPASLTDSPDPATQAGLRTLRRLFTDYGTLPPRGRQERITIARGVIHALRGQASIMAMPVIPSPRVGPIREGALGRLGLTTVEAILYDLPWRYEDRARITPINLLAPGRDQTVNGTILTVSLTASPRRQMPIVQIALEDGTGVLYATWFNQPYLKRVFEQARRRGERLVLSGKAKRAYQGRGLELESPHYEVLGPDDAQLHTGRIVPIYRETEGMSVRQRRLLAHEVLETYLGRVTETLPESLRTQRGLPSLPEALRAVHFPCEGTDLVCLNAWTTPGHRRLIFDECLFFQLGLTIRKRHAAKERKPVTFRTDGRLARSLLTRLPFTLTSAQRRVVDEISRDLASPHPMNRLLQGDVGSGKTIVALYAALVAIDSGLQAALMAPTEILAEQHFLSLAPHVEPLGVRIGLLTSGLKAAERRQRLEAIGQGEVDLVVGTHALIEDHVKMRRLGLVIIDEQHKFGVLQRSALVRKGCPADVLVMTATPIPRTLALSVYGDLDVSVLDELPPGRGPVETHLYPRTSVTVGTEASRVIAREMARGHQAYIVYPLVESTAHQDLRTATAMATQLHETVFPQARVGLLHGRLPLAEKGCIMEAFASGRLDLLVATSIVEVGLDVPNATLMVIEHAERFGLSQLHQLRGRVGRGQAPSFCLLLTGRSVTVDADRRLRAMLETTDGFVIADRDLEIRGPGEFLGTRQSGLPEFRLVDLVRDAHLIHEARTVAERLLTDDPALAAPPSRGLRTAVEAWWRDRIDPTDQTDQPLTSWSLTP